jgi:hypothetical protein
LTPSSASATASDEERIEAIRRRIDALRAVPVVEAPTLAEFVAKCLIVEKETGNLIPFDLWPEQKRALDIIEVEDFIAAVKGRQVGVTWLEEAAMLWAGTFWGNRAFPIARQNEDYAKDGIRRLLILAGYDPESEPPNLRVLPESPMPAEWRPEIVAKNVTEIRFANGSHFKALTATQQIGRGGAWYWGLADEYAFWMHPAKQRAALESGCARLHIVSTGNGEGDDFHQLCDKARAGQGKYKFLFVPAEADPRRGEDFFRENVAEATDPTLALREWARKPEDAFRAPEGAFFRRFDRDRHVDDVEAQPSWMTYRAIDFGYRHPACLWAQQAPSGQLFIVAEEVPENVTTSEFRDLILATDDRLGTAAVTQASYCDPAGRAANVQTAESEFEVLRRAHLNPRGKPSSVRDGCVRIMDALADKELPLVVSEACPGLIRALSQVKPHRTHPETYDNDHELFSHPLDALRYLLVNLRASASPPSGRSSKRRTSSRTTSF